MRVTALTILICAVLGGCGGDEEPARTTAGGTGTQEATTEPSTTTSPGSTTTTGGDSTTADDGASEPGGAADPDEPTSSSGGSGSGSKGSSGGSKSGSSRGSSGGDDDSGSTPAKPGAATDAEIKAFIEDYVTRYSRGDASICTEVFTQRHVERLTKRTGDAAVDKCRSDVAANKNEFKVKEYLGIKRSGGTATVLVVLIVKGKEYDSRVIVLDAPGGLRVDGAG